MKYLILSLIITSLCLIKAKNDDQDEFVGDMMEIDLEKPIEIPFTPPEPSKIWYKRYLVIMILGGMMIIYGTQFYFGQKKNKEIITTWLQKNLHYLKGKFSSVGNQFDQVDTQSIISRSGIIQETYNLYRLYSTGCPNLSYCLTTIELKRRQNVFVMITFNLLYPELDRISYEIILSLSEPFLCNFSVIVRESIKFAVASNEYVIQ